jgi:hypothetical protein
MIKTKYISKFFTGTILTGIFLLVLLGISANQINAQVFVSGTPKCRDINKSNNPAFSSIISDNGFGTGTPPLGASNYIIPNVGSVMVTYNSDSDINFAASGAFITAVIVKAGTGANVYVYDPATASGGPLVTPLNSVGNRIKLNHLVFCYGPSTGPTAAMAMVAGQVQVETGKLRGSTLVTILNVSTLETQSVYTNRLGYYQFEDLPVGDTYIVTVRSKGFTFAPQTFTLNDDNALDMRGYAVSRTP